MVKLSDVFDIWYGVNLEVVNCRITDEGIPFVSRQSVNNGIVCKVERIDNLIPNPKNTLSIAGSGSVLSTFYHQEEYYSGRDVYVAKPKQPLCDMEMLYYCFVIEKNKFRYNYGRQANKTLRDILVPSPEEIPQRYKDRAVVCNFASKPLLAQPQSLNTKQWKWFCLSDLFSFEKGKEVVGELQDGNVPLISATRENNGIEKYVDGCVRLFEGNRITVCSNGKPGICFFQQSAFCATGDVNVLTCKNKKLNSFTALFICVVLELDCYRYSYGRKYGLAKMKAAKIKLPATLSGNPDWDFMERYIKSLPYSACLQEEN